MPSTPLIPYNAPDAVEPPKEKRKLMNRISQKSITLYTSRVEYSNLVAVVFALVWTSSTDSKIIRLLGS